jgi:enoyl-CoA hydratase/carnithine racemase
MGDNVLLDRDGLIATVTLNRPDRRNSLSDPMLTELGAALTERGEETAGQSRSPPTMRPRAW